MELAAECGGLAMTEAGPAGPLTNLELSVAYSSRGLPSCGSRGRGGGLELESFSDRFSALLAVNLSRGNASGSGKAHRLMQLHPWLTNSPRNRCTV